MANGDGTALPSWPAEAEEAVAAVVLVDASSPLEEELLRNWVTANRPAGQDVEVFTITPSRRRRRGVATSPAVVTRLEHGDNPLVFAIRVVWSPPERDGTRSARWTDLLRLGDPRDPGFIRERVIANRRPDRMAIVVSEADLAVRALADHAAHPENLDPVEYVTLRAWRSLERAERALRGNRYKVPKFVHEELTARADFRAGAKRSGAAMDMDGNQSFKKASAYLKEMAASHSTFLIDVIANAIHAAYRQGYNEIRYDPADLAAVAALGQDHPVVFLPSHRSNLDRLALQYLLWENDLPPNHTAGGINMNFFPVGPLVRRTGVFFIRRSFKDNPLYKFVLQSYLDYLIEKRFPLEWYLEGGRSRSGKLLPPRYGLLSYVVDSWRRGKAEDVMLIPVSISYDQIQDLTAYTEEAKGNTKEKETLGWVIKAVSSLRRRYGDIHIGFAEPLSLAKELGTGAAAGPDDLDVAKLGLEVMYRISRVTPITPASVVVIAVLEQDGAPTIDEVGNRCRALAGLITDMGLPITEELHFDDIGEVKRLLALLAAHGNVSIDFDGGSLPRLTDDQVLRASYYRNAVVHHFLSRAITEMALAGQGSMDQHDFWIEVARLRDLLKFEFFFPPKEEFRMGIEAGLDAAFPGWVHSLATPDAITARLRPPVAAWALGPFLEAYQIAADTLLGWEGEVEEKQFLAACRKRGAAYRSEGRVGAASVSLPLFEQAMGLARHRGLLSAGPEERAALAAEIGDALRRTGVSRGLRARVG